MRVARTRARARAVDRRGRAPTPTPAPLHARRGRRRASRSRSYLDPDELLRAARAAGARSRAPGLRLPLGERGVRARVRRRRADVDRPAAGGDRADGRQGARRRRPRPRAGVPVVPSRERRRGAGLGRRSAAGQGGRGRRRQGDARRARRPDELDGRDRGRAARGAARRSATTACSSSATSSARATSRCRCSPTRTAPCVHLGERECSLQRRHQKVVEEAPSPVVDARAARADGRGRGRAGARLRLRRRRHGRVHRRRGDAGEFFFLEMNTRLQVEHPVTELVTGLDLVELQLRVAAGEPLALRAGGARAARPRGRGARSTPRTRPPASCPRPARCAPTASPRGRRARRLGHRGRHARSAPSYDPMLAKVIAHGADRADRARAGSTARSPTLRRRSASTTNAAFTARAARARRRARRRASTPA